MIDLDPRTTALVLIDLQKGIVALPTAPRSGAVVLEAGRRLADSFRAAKAPVVLVRVGFSADMGDAPPSNVDQPLSRNAFQPGWDELAPDLAQAGDIVVTKRQWGAFQGTDLDLQLRRRGIKTIVLGGIATNFGVESTARFAWELGYDVVLAEDVTAAASVELHAMALQHIFPRIARVTQAADLHFADVA